MEIADRQNCAYPTFCVLSDPTILITERTERRTVHNGLWVAGCTTDPGLRGLCRGEQTAGEDVRKAISMMSGMAWLASYCNESNMLRGTGMDSTGAIILASDLSRISWRGADSVNVPILRRSGRWWRR